VSQTVVYSLKLGFEVYTNFNHVVDENSIVFRVDPSSMFVPIIFTVYESNIPPLFVRYDIYVLHFLGVTKSPVVSK